MELAGIDKANKKRVFWRTTAVVVTLATIVGYALYWASWN